MDTHRGVCLCKRADAPVLQWLRSIRYQTASEDTVSHSVRLKDLIKSKIIQSIGVDDDMSRTWIRSLCPCFRDSNAPTEEQDQRLNLLTNQLSTASSLTLPKGECSIFSIEDSPRHVSPGRDQVASESTGAADLVEKSKRNLSVFSQKWWCRRERDLLSVSRICSAFLKPPTAVKWLKKI